MPVDAVTVREVIKLIEADGWYLDRQRRVGGVTKALPRFFRRSNKHLPSAENRWLGLSEAPVRRPGDPGVDDFAPATRRERSVQSTRSEIPGGSTSPFRHGRQSTMVPDSGLDDDQKKLFWGYGRDVPPELWPAAFPAARGERQSPIDIPTVGDGGRPFPYETAPGPLRFDYQTMRFDRTFFEDLHLEIKVPHLGDAGSVTAPDGGDAFELANLHVHTPSEHTVGGDGYPMELHLVHKRGPLNAQESLVVAILAAIGAASEELDKLTQYLPTFEPPLAKPFGEKTIREQPPEINFGNLTEINFGNLIPGNRSYFLYEGSLTTPPCTEGVRWFVLERPITATRDQILRFSRFVPGGNNRQIQRRNRRAIARYQQQ
jgi:carbonic anhydrase